MADDPGPRDGGHKGRLMETRPTLYSNRVSQLVSQEDHAGPPFDATVPAGGRRAAGKGTTRDTTLFVSLCLACRVPPGIGVNS